MLQIKTDQFAEAAKGALHDTYTRKFLDGMYANVKQRLKSMVSEEIDGPEQLFIVIKELANSLYPHVVSICALALVLQAHLHSQPKGG